MIPVERKPQAAMTAGKLFSDGGARGNPGPAGIGFLILDAEGRLLTEQGRYIGETTNNVAEYSALLAGLRRALELGISSLEAYSDSELMVRQINGQYKVRNDGLKELHREALRLAGYFDAVSFNHIPRKENHRADRLANRAMDEAATGMK